jgi:hypothetical protein
MGTGATSSPDVPMGPLPWPNGSAAIGPPQSLVRQDWAVGGKSSDARLTNRKKLCPLMGSTGMPHRPPLALPPLLVLTVSAGGRNNRPSTVAHEGHAQCVHLPSATLRVAQVRSSPSDQIRLWRGGCSARQRVVVLRGAHARCARTPLVGDGHWCFSTSVFDGFGLCHRIPDPGALLG